MATFDTLLHGIREINHTPEGFLPLHAPVFSRNEREYLLDTIDSTFVSSVGPYVGRFEKMLCDITGAHHAVACSTGTSALQVALFLAGVTSGDLVLTQSLTFVACANAIRHAGAEPVFLDVEPSDLGLSPHAVKDFLERECAIDSGGACRHKTTTQRVAACVPMHTFGLPCQIEAICEICSRWNIPVVEDAAEALGSLRNGRCCGTFGMMGTLSFNGNKICTTGGGGAIVTNDATMAIHARHLTTTAKRSHSWQFYHDEVAWNYRMPNLNAALGCAQLEQLGYFIARKRELAQSYCRLLEGTPWQFVTESDECQSIYWLCAVLFRNRDERDAFLAISNDSGIMTRPVWEPMHTLPMYKRCRHDALRATKYIADRLVNIPSGVMENVS